ncbi:MAG TPA: protein kinase family protein [Candidatus Acidoferrales bacterium]|nr:protein kinase family protein [Candidatus Acidoferrales bacterium]
MARDAALDGFLRLIEARPDLGGRYMEPIRVGLSGGDGHFSLLFSATDNRTNRRVAIKVFRPDRIGETYRYQSFCREAILLERLAGTPNILEWVGKQDEYVERVVSTTGIPFDLRFPYFAVELASEDVGAICRLGRWGPEQKLVAFREMCKAVQRIHKKEIVHRDIKPSNFLVMENGDVKLSDFGTARLIDGIEPPILANYPAAPGDTRYASPEMHALLHDDDPTICQHGDIFALGATLFELCTGAILGVQLFDASFAQDLAQSMGAVHKRDRRRIFLQFVQALDAGHPLPSISEYASEFPASIRTLVDNLYRSMASLDFRRRLCDFAMIFLKVNQCLLVLRNEAKLYRWRKQKEQYKQNHCAKLARRQEAVRLARRGDF